MFKRKVVKYLWLGPVGLLVVLALYNNAQLGWLNFKVNQEQAIAAEEARPANLEATVLESADCQPCSSADPYLDYLEKNGGALTKINKVEVASAEGQALIRQYQIKQAPALLVSGELEKKPALKSFFKANGEIIDGTFVWRNVFPPYLDLADNSIKGVVDLTMIIDSACAECYDVSNHQKIIQNFGVKLNEVKTVESLSAEGRSLISKYQLPYLPTIVMSPEISRYVQVKQLWPELGLVAEDGNYVFTEGVKQMGVYHDLALGKIVKPAAASSAGPAATSGTAELQPTAPEQ